MSFLPSTQDHLDFVDIRNDLVILKGGNFRIVIEATAINFDLLSEAEQNATIFAYATLVNSLEYTLQVVIRTRQIDITDYLSYLKSHLHNQPSAALRDQLQEYLEFVEQLVLDNTVLQKRFFIVVPYFQGSGDQQDSKSPKPGNFFSNLIPSGAKQVVQAKRVIPIETMNKAERELNQKFEQLKWQFKRLGIKIHRLNTEELIRLYYEIYNPESGKNQGLRNDLFGYTSGMVKSSIQQ